MKGVLGREQLTAFECAFPGILPAFRPVPNVQRVARKTAVRCLLPLLFLLLALVPASASAVTVTQVVSLSKAGVSQGRRQ